jgi:hypothetical protein
MVRREVLQGNEQAILDKRAEIAKADAAAQEAPTTALNHAEQLNNEMRNRLNNAMDEGTEAWTKFKDDFRTQINRVEDEIKNIHV